MSTDARWSDETEALVRRIDGLHQIEFKREGARCACARGWAMLTPYNAVDAHIAHERHRSRELLAALANAGLLLPPGGETEIQCRYTDRDGFTAIGITPEQVRDEGWRLLDTRAVTRWPDDRWHFGPWQPADVSGEDR